MSYLVGTPKGRLTKLEKKFLEMDWSNVRQDIDVKLLKQENEIYVLARSEGRVLKERQMRRRRLRRLLCQLKTYRSQSLKRDQLLMKLGAAKKEAGRAYGLVDIRITLAVPKSIAEAHAASRW